MTYRGRPIPALARLLSGATKSRKMTYRSQANSVLLKAGIARPREVICCDFAVHGKPFPVSHLRNSWAGKNAVDDFYNGLPDWQNPKR